MNRNFRIHINPQVYVDIQNQVDYYRKVTKSHKLGKRFAKTVGQEINRLKEVALHYEIKYDDIRCLPIPKFPHRAHFRLDEIENTVWVEAIIGTSENPDEFSLRTIREDPTAKKI